MKKLACRYAIVQFVPYAETGEFANIGVVLICPRAGYFGFQLQTRKHARVTGFFDEISGTRYRAAVKAFEAELLRMKGLLAKAPPEQLGDYLRALFTQLTAPRQALMQVGPERAILAEDPDQTVQTLFSHYVDRAFATPEYVEETVGKRLKSLLVHLQLPNPFKAERIGNDEIYANFPLVQKVQGVAEKAIKPFNLSQSEPNAIYDHGGTWLEKLRRLSNRGLLPPHVLFAVVAPPREDERRWRAYDEIRRELQQRDVQVVTPAAEPEIVEFARG